MRTNLKMETSRGSYQQVQIHSEDENVTAKPWKIIQRQVLVSSAVWSSFFTLGLLFGTPTVYIAQRRREENSTEAISIEMASWISSAHTYSAIPFFIIMAALSKYFGRKKTYLIACSIYFVGFMTIYLSTSVIEILIGECILGALLACDCIICGMVITEYTSSRYRGFFLTFKSATFAWGILVANLIGIFIDWRPIALLACMCSAYSFIVGLMWPESPYWLISNKDHNACSESHYWLKGKTEESMRELKELIKAHQALIQVKRERTGQHKAAELIKNLFSKTFYRFFSYSVLIAGLYSFSGKMACNVYAIQIIKSVIDNDSVANKGTLIVDAVCVISMYFASIFVKFYKRKHMLLITSSTGILFLFLISAYVYLTKWELINENKYVFLFLLTMYMIAISCGPIALSPTVIAELCPLRYRGFYMLCNGLSGNFILGTVVKFTPYLFSSVGPHGAFLFYGVSSLLFLTLIYFFVPETKDKTIVEMSYLMNQ